MSMNMELKGRESETEKHEWSGKKVRDEENG
jgi:hypothetical protein